MASFSIQQLWSWCFPCTRGKFLHPTTIFFFALLMPVSLVLVPGGLSLPPELFTPAGFHSRMLSLPARRGCNDAYRLIRPDPYARMHLPRACRPSHVSIHARACTPSICYTRLLFPSLCCTRLLSIVDRRFLTVHSDSSVDCSVN